MKLRAWIVDDEPLARRALRDLLAEEGGVEILGESPDGLRAVEDLHTHAPDVLFLDVQMPGLDGFEVLQQFPPDKLPIVVFVTAYDHYALRAFEAHAIDYLLKPLDPDRLKTAVQRARTTLLGAERARAAERLRGMLTKVGEERGVTRLLLRSSGSISIVPVREIDWVQADGDYARLQCGGRCELLRETLQSLAARLNPREFIRIHRSYLVRLERVRKIEALEDGDATAVLEDGTRLPVSRGHREDLLRALQNRG